MATFKDPAAFAREVARLQRDLERQLRSASKDMAQAGAKVAAREAARYLGGDTRFSGWSGPDLADMRIQRAGRSGHVLPPTRGSAGAWTVADRGRNKGNASGFQGPGVNRRTGLTSRTKAGNVRKVRAVKRRRWNGYTAGFGTAARAADMMDKAAEPIAERAMRTVIAKHFD